MPAHSFVVDAALGIATAALGIATAALGFASAVLVAAETSAADFAAAAAGTAADFAAGFEKFEAETPDAVPRQGDAGARSMRSAPQRQRNQQLEQQEGSEQELEGASHLHLWILWRWFVCQPLQAPRPGLRGPQFPALRPGSPAVADELLRAVLHYCRMLSPSRMCQ